MAKKVSMPVRDSRYDLIKHLITEGKISSFSDIFKYLPKTVVAIDMGKRGDRITELTTRITKLTLEELLMIAELCEIDEYLTFQLVMNDYDKIKKKSIKLKKNL